MYLFEDHTVIVAVIQALTLIHSCCDWIGQPGYVYPRMDGTDHKPCLNLSPILSTEVDKHPVRM